MLEKLKLTLWSLEDFGSEIGLVKANFDYLKNNKVASVFEKDGKIYELVQVGNEDYDKLDKFIKLSMNKFYESLEEGTEEESEQKKSDYRNLYEIWQSIMMAKENNQANIGDLYNDLVYALYMLGYKE